MPALNLRLIAFDRPGYGISDPMPCHASWQHMAADVGELATHMGLHRFPIVGVSGGGPLAAACARFMPERVSALALVSSVPPPQWIDRGGLGLLLHLGHWPLVARAVMVVARRFLSSPARAESLAFGQLLKGMDREVMNHDRRTTLLVAMREGLRRTTQGAAADAGRYGRLWGFQPQDIQVPTAIWHGTEDLLVPLASSQAFSAIPGSRLNVLPDEGHYSLAIGKAQIIIDDLLAQAGSRLD